MTDYDDYTDNEAWDVGGTELFHNDLYDPECSDYEDPDEFDCGWDGGNLCFDIGSEHCSFYCPFYRTMMDADSDSLPSPVDTPPVASIDDMDDIPF